jgi:hypothetical protein
MKPWANISTRKQHQFSKRSQGRLESKRTKQMISEQLWAAGRIMQIKMQLTINLRALCWQFLRKSKSKNQTVRCKY